MVGRPNVFRLLQLAMIASVFILPGFFIAAVLTQFIKAEALERTAGIRVGTAEPVALARMASLGFDCVPDAGQKHLTVTDIPQEEVLCRKSERIGFGLAGHNSGFIIAMFPLEWIYTLLPKDELSSFYRKSEIIFAFDRDVVSHIRPSVRLS